MNTTDSIPGVALPPSCSAAFASGESAFRRSVKIGRYDSGESLPAPENLEERRAWWDGFFSAAELVFKTGKLSPPNADAQARRTQNIESQTNEL